MLVIDELYEQALALGFESVEAMRDHASSLEDSKQRHAAELAYQATDEAQRRRDAARVPASTWVIL